MFINQVSGLFRLFLFVFILAVLAGCGSDGDDGATGATGTTGGPGPIGPAGPGITWETMDSSFTAEANKGYLVDGSSPVTVTLPESSSLTPGDIIEIDGIGTGGWKIAQRENQKIITTNISSETPTIITARESDRWWASVASSADGTKLVAVDSGLSGEGGQIYTSTDSGVNWTARMTDTDRRWVSVASSADGTKLVAAVYTGQIYTSTDSGANWTARASNSDWYSVASSADGTKLVATVYNGQIYTLSSLSTTPGPDGFISGHLFDYITLQYLGNDTFNTIDYLGLLTIN